MRAPYLGPSKTGISNRDFDEKFSATAIPVSGDNPDNPLYTGRHLITIHGEKNGYLDAVRSLQKSMKMKVAVSSDFQHTPYKEESIKDADIFLYEDLGVVLVSADPEEETLMTDAVEGHAAIVEPELVMYAIPFPVIETGPASVVAPAWTWGIGATNTHLSSYTGQGIRVAILDTGIDLDHPDFKERIACQTSLVPGSSDTQDYHGHGTHCTGIACGYQDTARTRYGVARDSDICIGKILNNQGRGAQSWAINGINWAVDNHCRVISMSIGAIVLPGTPYMAAYERTIANALDKGVLVVAAAGNDSRRPEAISPVSSPANCPSAIAVTAVDKDMQIAAFANGEINPGQGIFIAGPGVDVYSSWPMDVRYKTISGTSMATPFVSGILALLCQKYSGDSPQQIKDELRKLAKAIPALSSKDAGFGFVQAPS